MRYIENKEEKTQPLSTLSPGDVFKANLSNGLFFIVTELVTSDPCHSVYTLRNKTKSYVYLTAICLEDGVTHSFPPHYEVYRVENA